MKVKLLESGYWFVQLDSGRFAQWLRGTELTVNDCFPSGWWSTDDIVKANKSIEEQS